MLRRCLIVAALAVAYDSACAAYVLGLQRDHFVVAYLATAACPFLSFAYRSWFVDEPTSRRRLILTTADACGALVATTLVIWWFLC